MFRSISQKRKQIKPKQTKDQPKQTRDKLEKKKNGSCATPCSSCPNKSVCPKQPARLLDVSVLHFRQFYLLDVFLLQHCSSMCCPKHGQVCSTAVCAAPRCVFYCSLCCSWTCVFYGHLCCTRVSVLQHTLQPFGVFVLQQSVLPCMCTSMFYSSLCYP
jgi:hypothetical protein